MTVTPPTTAERAPRKPADHQASKSEQLQASAQPPVGWETLKPVEELRSGDAAETQASILDLFEEIGINLDADPEVKQEIETTPRVIRAIGSLAEVLSRFTVDMDAFVKVDTGKGAQHRIMDLAMWYLSQLGESDGSAS